MASPFPLSARDLREFRPAAAAVIAAREALEKAQEAAAEKQAAFDAAQAADDSVDQPAHDDPALIARAGAEFDLDEAKDAVDAAQDALDEAEAVRAKADPLFLLRVPTGRSKALVAHDVTADPDVPKFTPNGKLIAAVLAEAEDSDLSADAVTALKEAAALVEAGEDMDGDLWGKIYEAAQETPSGKRIIADRHLTNALTVRHTVRRHLVIEGRPARLSESDLDAEPVASHLGAIAAEFVRLSNLSADDAKNSAAP